jgi:SAM-dependent methyltransferase
MYPEVTAGGYTHVDGTVEFYQRVNALLTGNMTVLDFGAGRGKFLEDPIPYRRELQGLRTKVATLIGIDVDEVVLQNPAVTTAHVITPGWPLPLQDESVDLVVSDWTFEHVTDPEWAGRELDRVLRPGGWICARTPNRWGYIGIGARLIPNRFHVALLRRLQPHKAAIDTFPTSYRMNTLKKLRSLFPPAAYEHCTYVMNSEPDYVGSSPLAWHIMRAAFRLLPTRLGGILCVFVRKR